MKEFTQDLPAPDDYTFHFMDIYISVNALEAMEYNGISKDELLKHISEVYYYSEEAHDAVTLNGSILFEYKVQPNMDLYVD